MTLHRIKARVVIAVSGMLLLGAVATATPAAAAPRPSSAALRGTTSVTTAPGIALALIKGGVLPLPVPSTGFGLGFSGGLTATYRFPITGGDPNLAGPSGDILHSGGIDFVSLGKHLEIGKFDIDLAAGKIYADQVNFKPARIPVLDLNLSGLKVATPAGSTVLSGISVKLDPAAAGALNSTFGLALPTDGSLVFGSAVVTLKG
jgi:hypothetical protein